MKIYFFCLIVKLTKIGIVNPQFETLNYAIIFNFFSFSN